MKQKYDVIVCGGGVSGVCAAISAARSGAKTLLIEQTNCLGGTWTAGLVAWMLDINNKSGFLINEITETLQRRGCGRFARGGSFIYEPEAMKLLLDELCAQAGVRVRLCSFVCGVSREARRVRQIEVVSKSGREHISGKCFIDATGDGDVCALAGAEFDMGNEEGLVQPMSMFALVDGLNREELKPFDNSMEYTETITPKQRFREEIRKSGAECSQQEPALYYLFNDVFLMTANHQYGVYGTKAEDLTSATIAARREINNVVDSLRALGGIWRNIKLIATAPSIGVREGRRIRGEYTVTREDIYALREFPDSICSVSFVIDVHSLKKDNELGYEDCGDEIERTYQIPLRAAICKGFDNLFMTGRCICGDFYAHASYRVTGNAAVLGENIGKAAANASNRS